MRDVKLDSLIVGGIPARVLIVWFRFLLILSFQPIIMEKYIQVCHYSGRFAKLCCSVVFGFIYFEATVLGAHMLRIFVYNGSVCFVTISVPNNTFCFC